MLSFLFLVVLETCCCIVLLGYEFSEIGDQDFSNIGGFGKVGGLIQSRGCNPLHTIERHLKKSLRLMYSLPIREPRIFYLFPLFHKKQELKRFSL